MLGQRAIAHVVEHNPRHPVLFAYARTLHLTAKQTMTVAGCKTTHQRARREFGAVVLVKWRKVFGRFWTRKSAGTIEFRLTFAAARKVQSLRKIRRGLSAWGTHWRAFLGWESKEAKPEAPVPGL
jgi:hypothetical protein